MPQSSDRTAPKPICSATQAFLVVNYPASSPPWKLLFPVSLPATLQPSTLLRPLLHQVLSIAFVSLAALQKSAIPRWRLAATPAHPAFRTPRPQMIALASRCGVAGASTYPIARSRARYRLLISRKPQPRTMLTPVLVSALKVLSNCTKLERHSRTLACSLCAISHIQATLYVTPTLYIYERLYQRHISTHLTSRCTICCARFLPFRPLADSAPTLIYCCLIYSRRPVSSTTLTSIWISAVQLCLLAVLVPFEFVYNNPPRSFVLPFTHCTMLSITTMCSDGVRSAPAAHPFDALSACTVYCRLLFLLPSVSPYCFA